MLIVVAQEREEDSEAGEPHEEDVGNEDEQAEISFAAPNTTLEVRSQCLRRSQSQLTTPIPHCRNTT